MKKLIAAFVLSLIPVLGFASGAVHLDSANIDLKDQAALQRGAKLYVNYCLGCHSLKYFRYQSLMAFDLTEDQIKQNLMPSGGKIGELMTNAMDGEQAAKWFGAPPPDLTLEARLKEGGADWIYTYLRGFYQDASRPLGVNNRIFPNVGMPHVLVDLQGMQKAVFSEHQDKDGGKTKVFDRFEQLTPGQLSPKEYDGVARDLATFLTHVSEPMQLERQRLGIYAMIFMLVFFVLAYALKKEYWKDIH